MNPATQQRQHPTTHDGDRDRPAQRPEISPAAGVAAAIPPGALPTFDPVAAGAEAPPQPFLAPSPLGDRWIVGFGHGAQGRMPPHNATPSPGPLTGLPSRIGPLRPPPVPPAYRRQALEPGHREPDPLHKIPHVQALPDAAEVILLDGLLGIGQSAAALRSVPEPQRGASGRHRPLISAAGPAGAGSARVAASVGVPVADSVRTSDRGLYVAGRASGSKWDVSGAVGTSRAPWSPDPCAATRRGGGRLRPLSALNSMKRYVEQESELQQKAHDLPATERGRPASIMPSDGAGALGPALKGVGPAFKALSRAPSPPRVPVGEGKTGRGPEVPRDLGRERLMLALRAQIGGLAGRFGANSARCRTMDPTEALRPQPGVLQLRGETALAKTGADPAEQGRTPPVPHRRETGEPRPPAAARPSGAGRSKEARGRADAAGGCLAEPQKYAAAAGVRMRDAGAAYAETARPEGAAFAPVDGVPTEPQAPSGQARPPDPGGARRRALEERSSGDAGGGVEFPSASARHVDARGMGPPSAPVFLEVDLRLRAEAAALLRARHSAEILTREIDAYLDASNLSLAATYAYKNEYELRRTLEGAFRDMDRLDGATAWVERASAIVDWIRLSHKLQAAGNEVAAGRLATMAVAADRVAADLRNLRRTRQDVTSAARVLGNMDFATLLRRTSEAARRAEREMFRRQRRALRRERNGAFLVRQLSKAEAAYERASAFDARADRYRREAEAKRPGRDRDRAQLNADYYASLAEHERNRAAVAQSYVVSEEARRLGGARTLARRRRADERALRVERAMIEAGRSLHAHEVQLASVKADIDRLVRKDPYGIPLRDERGDYVPEHKSDSLRVRILRRKEEGLQSAMWKGVAKMEALAGGQLGSVRRELAALVEPDPLGQPIRDEKGDYVPLRKSDSLRVRILQRKEKRLLAERQKDRERAAARGRSELGTVRHDIARLVQRDALGRPIRDEKGNYVPLRKSDSLRLSILQRKERRLDAAQRARERRAADLGKGMGKTDRLLARRDALLVKLALSSATPPKDAPPTFALPAIVSLLPDSVKSLLRSKLGPPMPSPRRLQAMLQATQTLVNIAMSAKIKDALAKAEAALEAGKDAAVARYDHALSTLEREQAAATHEAALATAKQAVDDIKKAIANKTYRSDKELKRDKDRLARA